MNKNTVDLQAARDRLDDFIQIYNDAEKLIAEARPKVQKMEDYLYDSTREITTMSYTQVLAVRNIIANTFDKLDLQVSTHWKLIEDIKELRDKLSFECGSLSGIDESLYRLNHFMEIDKPDENLQKAYQVIVENDSVFTEMKNLVDNMPDFADVNDNMFYGTGTGNKVKTENSSRIAIGAAKTESKTTATTVKTTTIKSKTVVTDRDTMISRIKKTVQKICSTVKSVVCDAVKTVKTSIEEVIARMRRTVAAVMAA